MVCPELHGHQGWKPLAAHFSDSAHLALDSRLCMSIFTQSPPWKWTWCQSTNYAQLNTTQTSTNVTSAAFDLVDQQAESPDLFVRNGIYCELHFEQNLQSHCNN